MQSLYRILNELSMFGTKEMVNASVSSRMQVSGELIAYGDNLLAKMLPKNRGGTCQSKHQISTTKELKHMPFTSITPSRFSPI